MTPMAHAPYIAGIAFVALLTLRIYLHRRRGRWRVVGQRGEDLFVVRKRGGFRELLIVSPTHQQVQSRQDPRNELSSGRSYVDGFHIAMLDRPGARRILFLGGGACVGPRQFAAAYATARIDVVESEPLVVETAKKDFGLVPDERLVIHVEDARVFLASASASSYDVIVIDTYDAYRMPGHLVTKEFFAEVRAKLADGGAVVVNLVGSAHRTLVPGILGGLAAAFDGWPIGVFEVPDESGGKHPIGNFIALVASSLPDTSGATVAVAPGLGAIVAQPRTPKIDPSRAYSDAQPRTWIPVTD